MGQGLGLLGRIGDGALVLLLGGKLQVFDDLVELGPDAFYQSELGLGGRAAPQDGLRLGLVVPEALGEGLLGQLLERLGELGDVKNAPLAPQSAVGGRQGCRVLR